MRYPNYPQPISRVSPTSEGAKNPIPQQLKDYNLLKKLGFAVMAKKRTGKMPVDRWTAPDLRAETQLDIQMQDNASGWIVLTGARSNRLYVVDIDPAEVKRGGNNPEDVYHQIQALSQTQFVLATPANGVHLYYRIPEHMELLRNRAGVIKGVDTRGEGGLVVSLGGYNRYVGDKATDKGVADGHEAPYRFVDGGVYDAVPEMSEALYEFVSKKTEKKKRDSFNNDEMLHNYARTESGSERVSAHLRRSQVEQEAVVIECLSVIFDKFGQDLNNDEWTQVWMAAHHGSPTIKVRDYILSHPNVHWSDGDLGRDVFSKRWVAHQWQEDGYTIASLMWIARRAGWLTETGYEIPETRTQKINVKYITDWSKLQDSIPNRVLLQSQTGSGKTRHIVYLYERLGRPKTVIFVPTVKLATELSFSLQREGVPATLYLDETTKQHIGVTKMKEAKVLVTTLQTFATKIYSSGVPMSKYGLVYIEEIDQLLSGFSRGGGGLYSSHVSEKEARAGFKALREAFVYSDYVWGVDATMSQLSLSLAEAMSPTYVSVIRNEYVHTKAPVTFLDDEESAYNVILRSLVANKKVVVVCDTMAKAHQVHELMELTKVLKKKKSLVITRRTSHTNEVVEFMQDVNKKAAEYDLLCYNSVMGSGVSITDFVPDVIVQIATYLTPRNNLQMLNRYRKQNEVYCYYRTGENLYSGKVRELLEEFRSRVDVESRLIKIPQVARSKDADLRAELATTAVADEQLQNRSPMQFYKGLLERDGRIIRDGQENVSGILAYSMEKVKELKAQRKEHIRSNWRKVRPITNDDPPDPEMTSLEVALGMTHGHIQKTLRGNIPEVSDEYIYDVVKNIGSHGFVLTEFMVQSSAMSRAERYLIDTDKAISAIQNNVSIIKLVSLLKLLYGDMTAKLTPELLESNYRLFIASLIDNKEVYDAVIVRAREKFDEIYDMQDEMKSAVAFAKIILRQIGLKQKSERLDRQGGQEQRYYYIANLAEATDFLLWRNHDDPEFTMDYTFSTKTIDDVVEKRRDVSSIFRDMDADQQTRVLAYVTHEEVSFDVAVKYVSEEATTPEI